MKFFKLLYFCLMSFITISFAHGMDFGMGWSDIPTPSWSSSSSPESSGKIQRALEKKPESTISQDQLARLPQDNSDNVTIQSGQYRAQSPQKLRGNLDQFNTFNSSLENTSPQQKKQGEELTKKIHSFENYDFKDMPLASGLLKNDPSTPIRQYHEKESEKKSILNTIITPVMPTELINRILTPPISIKETIPLLPYPLSNPLADAFTYIDMAIDNNKENFLIDAIKECQRLYKNFKITSPDFFRIKYANLLRQNMFEWYLLNSIQTPLEIFDEVSHLPFLLNGIEFYQDQENTDNNQQLKNFLVASLLKILNHLKQANPILNKNMDLIQEILFRTRLSGSTKQACLLLLNKVENFYPQIKSDLATTIIDDIAANYFTLSEQSQSQAQKNKLLVQDIKWLTLVPLLEPLFSQTLKVSSIPDDELEDYLEKITLLELNSNPSPSAQQKLQEIEEAILKESHKRSEPATIETRKAKVKTEEKLKTKKIPQLIESSQRRIQSIAPAMGEQQVALRPLIEQMQEKTDEWGKAPGSSSTIYDIQRKITNILFKKWDDIQPDDYSNLKNSIDEYNKEKPVFLGEVTIHSAYSTLKNIEDILKKKASLHADYLATLSNQELVNRIESLAFSLLSSSTTPINDKTLDPIFKYTDQLIKNKAATGKDGVIEANHFINIAKTIDLLRKLFHVLDPENNNQLQINIRIQKLLHNINNRDKNELIQQIKEHTGRFNRPEKNVIKDIINDYYFSSYAHSYNEPLFGAKNSILAALETMEPQKSTETGPGIPATTQDQPELPSSPLIFDTLSQHEPSMPPVELKSITPQQAEANAQRALNIALQNMQERRLAAQPIPQAQIHQTPSFWEKITNTISSFFNWLFGESL